ncbi:hypothetical protein [Vibrio scophthalmi]|uniref:Uncharacterized protein n=1 Tax=Vibrio scophthalmi LMG 19158 TaxID=870967 RepID=F9RIC5_9VIBR|nr:hypothetical protein [Vibrio scophthalmi]EGU42457.1 hypothetical protein VIS19158_11688 [Vibrio scophthalmi LMG 19158]
MALVKNDAKTLADEDQGLGSHSDSYLQKCIDVTAKPWKEAKDVVNNMNVDELASFVSATSTLDLSKIGTVTVRLSINDYASLRLAASKNGMTITNAIETAIVRMNK